ncbi:MAG: hypothetical protein JETT_1821 [Candidatus Jettenia ecosi]|uniref:Uncharacterized protein n=1 Tax=Candidatus Jettenia ecosi TaxID=2494326 RepID=A0A533QMS4_9BACT|nr:MAG: hypothetical protein JETT_1821 [Candidatus Jettenia ecosi]
MLQSLILHNDIILPFWTALIHNTLYDYLNEVTTKGFSI